MVLEPEKLTQRIALGLGVVALTIAAGFTARYIRTLKADLNYSRETVVKLQTELRAGSDVVTAAKEQLAVAQAQIKKANSEYASYQIELKQVQREREAIKKERADLATQRSRLEREAEEHARRARQTAADQAAAISKIVNSSSVAAVRCMEVVSVGKNNELVKDCILPPTRNSGK
jgi:chromosome segregation ATPase